MSNISVSIRAHRKKDGTIDKGSYGVEGKYIECKHCGGDLVLEYVGFNFIGYSITAMSCVDCCHGSFDYFGDWVMAYRERTKRTRKEFAPLLGVKPSTLKKYEFCEISLSGAKRFEALVKKENIGGIAKRGVK